MQQHLDAKVKAPRLLKYMSFFKFITYIIVMKKWSDSELVFQNIGMDPMQL